MKNRLKELRLARRLTQRQVAEKAGMSVSYYTEIELGKKQLNALRLETLAKALDCTISEIIVDPKSSADTDLVVAVSRLDEAQRRLVLDMALQLAGSPRKKP